MDISWLCLSCNFKLDCRVLKMLIQHLIVLLFVIIVKAENGTEKSKLYFTDLNNNIIDFKSYCTPEKPCVRKCCDVNKVQSIIDASCIDIPDTVGYLDTNFTELPIYSKYLDINNMIKLNKTVTEAFKIIIAHNYEALVPTNDYYVTEDGFAMENYPNRYRYWVPYTFCMDYIYDNTSNSTFFNVFLVEDEFEAPSNADSPERILYSGIGLAISCFFMLIALIVYGMLPELRNLNGLVSIATIFTMFFAFINFSIDNLVASESILECKITSIFKYFLFMSTFFWMTVNSYDKFRIFFRRLPVRMSRSAKRKRFACYCLVAWGTPMIMTIFVVVLDELDLSDYPRFIKPGLVTQEYGCFFSSNFSEDHEKALYLYTPILILIFINMLLCSITGFNIWRDSQYFSNSANLNGRRDSTKSKPDKEFFWVYLKLSTLTGISWIFEIVINYMPSKYEWFKYIVDTYNMLFGVIIFFMFIFKKRIFDMLCKKYLSYEMAHNMGLKYHKQSSTISTMRKISSSDNTEYSSVKFIPDNSNIPEP